MQALRIMAADPVGSGRLLFRVAWLFAALGLCLPLHGLWRLLRRPSPWAGQFLAFATRACGVRVSIVGMPRRRDVFFVANHLSWIDIPILGGVTGTAFVSQEKIRNWPIIGWLAKVNHTVFISRTDRMAVGEQVAELRAALAENQPIAIFPEGTTTDGRSLLPFKPPLFAVLLPPPGAERPTRPGAARPTRPGAARPSGLGGLMIQPVVLEFDDAGKSLAWIGEETAPQNAWRVFRRRGSFGVCVHFLDPFDPGAHPHRKAISAEARRRIAAALSAQLGHPVD